MVAKLIRRVLRDRRGGTAIEYGLIAALVILTMVSALAALADTTTGMWNNVNDKVTRANGG